MPTKRAELLREIEIESLRSTSEGLLLFQAIADQSGMNLTDLQCLNMLATTGPVSAGHLAEMMGLTTGAITGLVNRLERAGYVKREKDPDDARRVLIQAVPETLESAGIGGFSWEGEVLQGLLDDYDDRDLALILDLFRKSNAITREQIALIRAASRGETADEGARSKPLDSVANGRLVFANGTSQLTLDATSGIDDLYRANFEGVAPSVKVKDGTVTFRYSRRFLGHFDGSNYPPGEVTLNASVPWEVEVRGGAYHVKADFETLKLTSFTLKGGIFEFDLRLGEPSGNVPVLLDGGAGVVHICRPAGVEARVTLKNGAVSLTFDGDSYELLGGKTRLQSPGYEGAVDRYEIEVTGGASEIRIE